MLDDHENGDRRRTREQGRPRIDPVVNPIGAAKPVDADQQRKRRGSRDRAERDVALPGDQHDEHGQRSERRHGHQQRQDAGGGRHSLAATEAEKEGEHMPRDRRDRGRRQPPGAPVERTRQDHRRGALGGVQQQREQSRPLARSPQHVRRAGAPAADRAHVDAPVEAHDEVAPGQGPEEVGGSYRDGTGRRHGGPIRDGAAQGRSSAGPAPESSIRLSISSANWVESCLTRARSPGNLASKCERESAGPATAM